MSRLLGPVHKWVVSLLIMDTTNPIIQLCIQGAFAEFEKRLEDARALYQQAWDLQADKYEACIAAHYMARFQDTPEETLRWNQIALERANAVSDESVKEFYPSLYLNLGRSHEALGNHSEATHEALGNHSEAKVYYDLAAELGAVHQPD